MPIETMEIVRCPAELRLAALGLVLCELSPSARRELAGGLLGVEDSSELANEPLFIARRDGELRGAAWGQRQSGNIAVFWPPQIEAGEDERTALRLAEAVVAAFDVTSIEMAQAFLSAPFSQTVSVLRHVGFRHLADLLYMTCESPRFPIAAPEPSELEYVAYDGTQRSRLARLIEKTYEETLDCAALDGVRDIEHVINGYQATGVYRSENWLFVRNEREDVGVLLLADHPEVGNRELMYMGVVPRARGRGWGRQITCYALWLARGGNVERIVVAVDAANSPAVAMYSRCGFEMWDRRAVYARIPAKS